QPTLGELTAKTLGIQETDESSLIAAIKSRVTFPSPQEEQRIISGLRWMGLLSNTPAVLKGTPLNLLDTLCGRLEGLMKFEPGEADLVMLQHKFVVEWADGRNETITSTLEAYGSTLPGGHSAMAVLVGVPCGIAVQLVLDGVLNKPGVQAPYSKDVCDPLREKLEEEGITMVEASV
ncbi:hypothetical protein FRC01_013321, partial [Tulasnella sp. 417]